MAFYSQRPTEGELEILSVLWELKEASVKEVHQKLSVYKQTGYTTTLKLLQLMFDKKIVSRTENGRKHVYRPRIDRQALREQQINRMIGHFFEGSPLQLALEAIQSSYYKPTPEQIKEFKRIVAAL